MRDRDRGARRFLDDPVCPDARGRQLNQVVHTRVRRIAVDHVLHCGFLPIDVNCSQVDTPDDDILAVGGDLLDVDVDFEVLNLIIEIRTRDHSIPPRHKWALILADGRYGCSRRIWIASCGPVISENTPTVEIVCARAVASYFCSEPIVARSLIRDDNDIVTLADTQ